MPDYQEFLRMARERRAKSGVSRGDVVLTRHAEYKMRQYRLSVQRIRAVIRNPKRREEGIAKDTVAVMQPVSVKRRDGKETWNQEIWVMFTVAKERNPKSGKEGLRVISAWRYPGVSPERNPVPEEILREIEEGCIFEENMIF